uniref:Uncharacterized protein n=1 Tax=Sinocyclocheilus rhinocerous TaxID=307959 RepID=A0A673NJ54_9TELE
MASPSEEDFSCPICLDVFKDPVVLVCSHSFCLQYIGQFWRTKETPECPVQEKYSKAPSASRLLKNLCESLRRQRTERRSSGSEEICSLHSEKLKLFCLEDKQPVCLVCRDSQQHDNHTFRPISEAVSTLYYILLLFLKITSRSYNASSQADHTEHQIKQQLQQFHQFLRDEEEATITALREEEEIKPAVDCVSSAPVILDPNTAHPRLFVSDDLTSVRYSENKQPLPDNPERFNESFSVLGSEGFNSGTHCWDVEVKESQYWSVGVTAASNQRKGHHFYKPDEWSVSYKVLTQHSFPVEQKLEQVRVYLDYDRGTVSFSDPVTNTHLHTFTTTFTDTVLPFFFCYRFSPLRILPFNSQ